MFECTRPCDQDGTCGWAMMRVSLRNPLVTVQFDVQGRTKAQPTLNLAGKSAPERGAFGTVIDNRLEMTQYAIVSDLADCQLTDFRPFRNFFFESSLESRSPTRCTPNHFRDLEYSHKV